MESMLPRVLTLLVAGLLAACSDQKPGSPAEGPVERAGSEAGKAIDRTVQAAVRETGNAVLHSKVRVALLDALGTDALRMEIDVNEGNVSLAGKVRDAASRDRAGDVVRKVTGVKDVTVDLQLMAQGSDDVVPPDELAGAVADRKLEAKVRLQLLEEIGAAALKLGIEVEDGAVTLSGRLDEAGLRNRAEEAAKGIDGVDRVINDIGIEGK